MTFLARRTWDHRLSAPQYQLFAAFKYPCFGVHVCLERVVAVKMTDVMFRITPIHGQNCSMLKLEAEIPAPPSCPALTSGQRDHRVPMRPPAFASALGPYLADERGGVLPLSGTASTLPFRKRNASSTSPITGPQGARACELRSGRWNARAYDQVLVTEGAFAVAAGLNRYAAVQQRGPLL